MNSFVSIIVPNYNHSSFLEQRLNSIYNQTYQNFEVILLDDASTDNSVEILNSYKNHPKTAHLIINSINSGSTFKQWKKGIELAKGDLIWIAESDDFAAPNFLELISQPLIENEKIGISYCQSIVVDENSKELYTNTKWTEDLDKNRWENDFIVNGVDECTNYLLYKNTLPNASAVVFRKNLINSFPLEFKMAGDWWFWVSILLNTKLSFKAKPLNYFRQHKLTTRQHNTDHKKKLRINEGLKIIKLLEPYLEVNRFNETVIFNYQWYLKTLPLKKLFHHFFNPYNSFVIKLNYSKLVSLTLKEFFYRLKSK